MHKCLFYGGNKQIYRQKRNRRWQSYQNGQMEAVFKPKPVRGDIRTSERISDMLANMTRKTSWWSCFTCAFYSTSVSSILSFEPTTVPAGGCWTTGSLCLWLLPPVSRVIASHLQGPLALGLEMKPGQNAAPERNTYLQRWRSVSQNVKKRPPVAVGQSSF